MDDPQSPCDPFSPRSSGRNPFPAFEVAMAPSAPPEGRSALDWSIDTLAELKPVPMTPPAAPTSAAPSPATALPPATPSSASPSPAAPPARGDSFFDDPGRCASLRTPSPVVAAELHARCREAIARCQRRLRDRQRKMDGLRVRPSSDGVVSPPAKRTRPGPEPGPGATRRSPQWWASPAAPAAKRSVPRPVPSFACDLSPIAPAKTGANGATDDAADALPVDAVAGDSSPPARRQEAFTAAMEAAARRRTPMVLHGEARARWSRLLRP